MNLSAQDITAEILTLPEQEQQEVADFIEFLKTKLAGLIWLLMPNNYQIYLKTCRVSDSVTQRIGAANVGLRYLATFNKLTRQGFKLMCMGRVSLRPIISAWLSGNDKAVAGQDYRTAVSDKSQTSHPGRFVSAKADKTSKCRAE